MCVYLLERKFRDKGRAIVIEARTPFAWTEGRRSEHPINRNIQKELLPEETISLSILQLKTAGNSQRLPRYRVQTS